MPGLPKYINMTPMSSLLNNIQLMENTSLYVFCVFTTLLFLSFTMLCLTEFRSFISSSLVTLASFFTVKITFEIRVLLA